MAKKNKKNDYDSNKFTIMGTFDYKKKKKNKETNKDILRKKKKKAEKKLQKQARCNHIARNDGKTHFEKVNDHKIRCKICGGEIINDESLMTRDIVETAATTLYSVMSYYRNNVHLSEKSDALLTNAIMINSKAVDMLDLIIEKYNDRDKKAKDKKKKKDRNKKNAKMPKRRYSNM